MNDTLTNTEDLPVQDSLPESDEKNIETSAGSDAFSEEETPSAEPAELESLRREVSELRAALAAKEQEQQNTLREIGEFHRLFPDIPVSDVPDGVWDSVERGIPLSAAYALYEKKQQASEGRAEEINRRNASLSAGKAGKHTAGEYFSPDEVRAMSQRQVHDNYRAIMDSMKHWH